MWICALGVGAFGVLAFLIGLLAGYAAALTGANQDRCENAYVEYSVMKALSLDADSQIRNLEERAAFGDQCYQDRCENAYVEYSVMKKAVEDAKAEGGAKA